MDIFASTFEAVATLLFIGFIGFYVISRRVIPENALNILASLAIDITLPALVFVNIITRFDPLTMADWWILPLYFLIFTAGAFVLSKISSSIFSPKYKTEFTVSLFYQNAVFFPIAIIGSREAIADTMLVKLFLFTLLFSPFFFSTAGLFFARGNVKIEKSRMLNPVMAATLIAVVLVFSGLKDYVPEFALSSLKLVGNMAVPLLMLIFGGNIFLDYRNKGRIEIYEVVKFVLAKNVLFPAVMLLFLILVKPDYELGFLLILQAAVPPITSLPVLASRCGGNVKILNQFMVASFIASLFTIPLYLMLFNKFYAQ
jgi:malate permease and related proteins